jgi:hypothetical protein
VVLRAGIITQSFFHFALILRQFFLLKKKTPASPQAFIGSGGGSLACGDIVYLLTPFVCCFRVLWSIDCKGEQSHYITIKIKSQDYFKPFEF